MRILVALLLCASTALAAEPAVRSAAVGELVVIDSASDGSLTWHAYNAPAAKSYVVVDGGKRLVFASTRAGSFTFLEISGKADAAGAVVVTVQEHRVTVTGGTPTPGPIDPPPPVSRFQLEGRVRSALLKVPVERRGDASQLGTAAYLTTVEAIDGGTLKNLKDVLDFKKNAVREVLGEHLEAWKGYGAEETAALDELSAAGKLKTVADYRQAFFEIATGLMSNE